MATATKKYDVAARALTLATTLLPPPQCQHSCPSPTVTTLNQFTIQELFRQKHPSPHSFQNAVSHLTSLCIAPPLHQHQYQQTTHNKNDTSLLSSSTSKWYIATAPARIDLAGGWTDTPPVCYEYGGKVATLAVTVNNRKPLSCRTRILKQPKIRLLTEARDFNGTLLESELCEVFTVSCFSNYNDPTAPCALLKCALLYLGLCPFPKHGDSSSIQPYLKQFCHGFEHNQDCGLEIISTSLLPKGSGMGSSSILAGCILRSIADCVGVALDNETIVDDVLILEQMLSCGGGWQDQLGGLMGGCNLGRSDVGVFPLKVPVKRIPLSERLHQLLNERIVLVFSGVTRLAKGILQQVLKRWALRKTEIVTTVQNLVQGAEAVSDTFLNEATMEDDEFLEKLAMSLNDYWSYKKVMAGEGSGVEPPVVKFVMEELFKRQHILAASLCGAGGGGFMVLLASEGRTGKTLKKVCEEELACEAPDVRGFQWCEGRVCEQGLVGFHVDNTTFAEESDGRDHFDVVWHDQ